MSCPDDQTLKLFIIGRLTPQQVERMETHLETCPACSERLAELETGADISILDDIRAAHRNGSESGTLGDKCTLSPNIPRSIGHYNVLGILGAGGMGTVYLAENPHLGRNVAIKVVKSSNSIHQTSVDRFSREMKTLGQLQHSNIVQALDGGVADEEPYLVLEYLEGCGLSRYVQRHVKEHDPLPVKQVCNIICQAAVGLDYAHRLGFVHRDIKPSNLWRMPNGVVKILDFGLVGLLEKNKIARFVDFNCTPPDMILGSPAYMAPEQSESSKKADNRSDIYSLGCTFFYLLTGTPPFGEKNGPSIVKAHAEDELPQLHRFRQDVPHSVETVLRKMTAKQPTDRFQQASDIASALEALVK